MVIVSNGIEVFSITAGALPLYEGMGFHKATKEEIYGGTPKHVKISEVGVESDAEEGEGEHSDSEDEVYVAELLEKPLTQWTNEEIKEFVRIKGIDTSSAAKVSQVRGIIKTYLEEQTKNA